MTTSSSNHKKLNRQDAHYTLIYMHMHARARAHSHTHIQTHTHSYFLLYVYFSLSNDVIDSPERSTWKPSFHFHHHHIRIDSCCVINTPFFAVPVCVFVRLNQFCSIDNFLCGFRRLRTSSTMCQLVARHFAVLQRNMPELWRLWAGAWMCLVSLIPSSDLKSVLNRAWNGLVKSLQQYCQALFFLSEIHHKSCCLMWPKLTIDWLVSLCPKLTIDWLVSLCLKPGCQPWFSVRSFDLRKMGEDTTRASARPAYAIFYW